MHGKTLMLALVLGLLAVAAWVSRDPGARQQLQRLTADLPMPGTTTAPPTAARPAPALRKCSGPQGVTYTDGDCPPGSRAQPVAGGTLTVLPATPAPAPAAASARPLLRELAGPADAPSIQDRVIDQIK